MESLLGPILCTFSSPCRFVSAAVASAARINPKHAMTGPQPRVTDGLQAFTARRIRPCQEQVDQRPSNGQKLLRSDGSRPFPSFSVNLQRSTPLPIRCLRRANDPALPHCGGGVGPGSNKRMPVVDRTMSLIDRMRSAMRVARFTSVATNEDWVSRGFGCVFVSVVIGLLPLPCGPGVFVPEAAPACALQMWRISCPILLSVPFPVFGYA